MRFLRDLITEVVGESNTKLAFFWGFCLLSVLLLGLLLSYQPVSILGVAESREFNISFEGPVEIKRIYVSPNQEVAKGDLLAELNQESLKEELRILANRRKRLETELSVKHRILKLTDIEVHDLALDPLELELKDVKMEMEHLQSRLKNLYIFADRNGIVATINYRSGEKVPAFMPFITLLPKAPSFINGYLNESYQSSVAVGENVHVSSASGAEVVGQVISVGSRVIPIPERLLRIPSLLAWGREVQVQIPQENHLISGEKVTVTKIIPLNIFSRALATDNSKKNKSTLFKKTLEMSEQIRKMHPEFSGLIYVKEIRRFLAISDDYPQNTPVLFMITEDGVVEDQVLDIKDVGTVKDLESISEDRGRIYLLSSLSKNKKGQKENRQWFLEVERHGLHLRVKNRIELGPILTRSLQDQPDILESLEIEAHKVVNGSLFFIIKKAVGGHNHFKMGKIENLESLFELQNGEVRWEKPVVLPFETELFVTDMTILANNTFLLSTSCRKQRCSLIWKVRDEKAEHIYMSEEKHLEGIALTPHNILYGVHDSLKTPYMFNLKLEETEN